MRLYGCFEFENAKGPVSAPVPAKDLRTGQSVKLYRWTPEAGRLALSQALTKEICAQAGVEVFSDGKTLWLVEADVPVGTVLRELRVKQLFLDLEPVAEPAPLLPPTIKCATCKTVRDASVALCPTCAATGKQPTTHVFRYVLMSCVLALIAATAYLVLRPPSKAPDALLVADRTQIRSGERPALSWSTRGADRVTLDGKIVEPNAQNMVVAPFSDRTYTLRATNRAGTTQREVTIHVRQRIAPPRKPPNPLPFNKGLTSSAMDDSSPLHVSPRKETTVSPPIEIEVTVDPSIVQSCRPAMLHWQISGEQSARKVDLQPRFFSLPVSGERNAMIIQPPVSQDYTLTFTMLDGRTIVKTHHVEVTRSPSPGPPPCGQIVWSGTVPRSGQVTVNWVDGVGNSQPETAATINGRIPDYGVQLSAIEPWVTVFAQPDSLRKPAMQFLSSHIGPVVIHFFWQRVGRN